MAIKQKINLRNFGLGLLGLGFIAFIIIGMLHEISQAPWQFVSILIGFIGAIIAFASNWQIQIRNEQKPKKIEIYEKIINFFFDSLFAEKINQKPKTEEELVKGFVEMTPDIILWASDDVLKNYIKFRQNTQSSDIFLFGEMLLAMRKDLGHQNHNLTKQEILGTFVNDIPQK
ncbi:hypothetical protein [Picosynechococcus sp. NKBG15041c]|uniref:hypothetical protein n=1 Tax=Picosynechococcus sp. NKBG15041c TaxID=1407650 RepID=UPI00191C621B|nr:hypothetical protein [Picosynechococcus sp. NKBG15041c]